MSKQCTKFCIPFSKIFAFLTVSAQPLTRAQTDLFVVLTTVAEVLTLRVALAGCIGIELWLNTMYYMILSIERLIIDNHGITLTYTNTGIRFGIVVDSQNMLNI